MKYQKIILILILFLAFVIRFWQTEKVPSSLYWDEMDVGYQAYSFMKTGKDYFGNSFPIYFHSFADFRTPLFIYSTIPFIQVFGLNEFSARLPSVIFGVLSVLLLYLIFKELTAESKWAWVPALFFALSPWQMQYSRIAFELSLMQLLFLLGLYGFLRGLKNPRWLFISALGFGLSAWTYSIAKLFIPLFLVILVIIYAPLLKKIKSKIPQAALAVFLILLIPILFSNFFGGGGQRFSEISIFTDPTAGPEINIKRLEMGLSSGTDLTVGLQTRTIDKLVYNKPLYFLDKFFANYLMAFSPEFLFIEGDLNLRHSPSGIGQLYRIEILMLILGAVYLVLNFKKLPKGVGILIILWLMLAPIPSALTRDGANHASRLFFLSPVLILIMSFGFLLILKLFTKRIAYTMLGVYFLVLFSQSFIFLSNYFTSYKYESATPFQYGYKQAVIKANELKGNYDRVILDDNDTSPLMAYLFVNKYDPERFQKSIKNLDTKLFNEIEARNFDNLYFTNPVSRDWYSYIRKNELEGKNLLIASASQMKQQDPEKLGGELGLNGKILEVIYYPNRLPAFYVMEIN